MNFGDILLIGLGLSMDAVAVSISDALAYPCMPRHRKLAIPIAFGVFQGLMPALGYFAGSLFAGAIEKYAGYATLLILGIIGFNMIREGLATPTQEALDCSLDKRTLSLRTLLGQAVATSIDAFAVGVSFSLQGANIFAASPVIAVTTFICSFVALLLGQRFGRLLGSRAEVLGGVILLLIAAKAVL